LLLLVAVICLHNFGLPGPLRRALVQSFARQGVNLQFSSLRLSWYKGIVAEQVVLRPVAATNAPQLEGRRVDLDLAPAALFRLRVEPQSVALTDGVLRLPYQTTNGESAELSVSNLNGTLRFVSGGGWHVDSLQGQLGLIALSVSGQVTNGGSLGDWQVFRPRATTVPSPLPKLLRQCSELLDSFAFTRPPALRLVFNVDGAQPQASTAWLDLKAGAAEGQHARWEQAEVTLSIMPAPDSHCSHLEAQLTAQEIHTVQGLFQDVQAYASVDCQAEVGALLSGRVDFAIGRAKAGLADLTGLDGTATFTFAGEQLMPEQTRLELSAEKVTTQWGWGRGIDAEAEIAPIQPTGTALDHVPTPLLQHLDGLRMSGVVTAEELQEPTFGATNLSLGFTWQSPRLELKALSVELPGGKLDLTAGVDAATGQVQFKGDSTIDPKGLSGVLPEVANEWLDRYTWQQPPQVTGSGSVHLPRWSSDTNSWPGDVRPSLILDGRFEAGRGTFRRMPVQAASSALHYSNMFWNLPDLTVVQPDGRVVIEHINNDRTSEYLFRVQLRADPSPAWALLPTNAVAARQTLGQLQFGSPPHADFTVTGFWRDTSQLNLAAQLHATNVTFRGVAVDEVSASAHYTHQTLRVTGLQARRGQQQASADSLEFRFADRVAFLSNGMTTLPPMDVATVIGPEVVQTIAPYRFLNPPEGRVEGTIPLGNIDAADLRFGLKGGPFEWWKFKLPEIEGLVRWKGRTVSITNLEAILYGGAARGRLFLDFREKPAPDFTLQTEVFGADLQPLVNGLFGSTNHLEGRLSGTLVVTQANAGDFGSWFGHGTATLKDGFIWNIPVFGVVSPVLDTMVPGLGKSRASAASGTFNITNSVIRSEDLVIRSSNMRLRYNGTVDFQGRVEATTEADLLRDTFVIGEAVSLIFTPVSKLMIMEITGTLAEPNARPYYVLPRVLLAPLNPVKMFKDFFTPEPPASKAAPANVTPEPPVQPPSDKIQPEPRQ
jgi:hypothetical protein